MNPARKRTVRLVVALSAAVVLASALIYTSFSAASPALTPEPAAARGPAGAQLPADRHGRAAARCTAKARCCDFSVEDRAGGAAIPLAYTGTVPDPFREGREVIVTVEKQGDALRRRTQLADHQVPLEVQDRSAEREPELLSAPPAQRTTAPGGRR